MAVSLNRKETVDQQADQRAGVGRRGRTHAGRRRGRDSAQAALVAPGPNKVPFQADWAKGTLYATVDRPDSKQYRELYTSAELLAAVRAGKPIPDGTVLTLAAYAAQVDAAGNPLKDANGRFMKGNLVAVNVMQKKAGWGDDIPAAIRNGDWV